MHTAAFCLAEFLTNHRVDFMLGLQAALGYMIFCKDHILFHAAVFLLLLLVVRIRMLPDFIMTCSILLALINTLALYVLKSGVYSPEPYRLYHHIFHYGISPGAIGYDIYTHLLNTYPAFRKIIPFVLTNVDYRLSVTDLSSYLRQEMVLLPIILGVCGYLKFVNIYRRRFLDGTVGYRIGGFKVVADDFGTTGQSLLQKSSFFRLSDSGHLYYRKTIIKRILFHLVWYVLIGFILAYWMSESSLENYQMLGNRPTEYIPYLPFMWLSDALTDPVLMQIMTGAFVLVVGIIGLLIFLAFISCAPIAYSSPLYTTTTVTQYVITGPPEVNDLIG